MKISAFVSGVPLAKRKGYQKRHGERLKSQKKLKMLLMKFDLTIEYWNVQNVVIEEFTQIKEEVERHLSDYMYLISV